MVIGILNENYPDLNPIGSENIIFEYLDGRTKGYSFTTSNKENSVTYTSNCLDMSVEFSNGFCSGDLISIIGDTRRLVSFVLEGKRYLLNQVKGIHFSAEEVEDFSEYDIYVKSDGYNILPFNGVSFHSEYISGCINGISFIRSNGENILYDTLECNKIFYLGKDRVMYLKGNEVFIANINLEGFIDLSSVEKMFLGVIDIIADADIDRVFVVTYTDIITYEDGLITKSSNFISHLDLNHSHIVRVINDKITVSKSKNINVEPIRFFGDYLEKLSVCIFNNKNAFDDYNLTKILNALMGRELNDNYYFSLGSSIICGEEFERIENRRKEINNEK